MDSRGRGNDGAGSDSPSQRFAEPTRWPDPTVPGNDGVLSRICAIIDKSAGARRQGLPWQQCSLAGAMKNVACQILALECQPLRLAAHGDRHR